MIGKADRRPLRHQKIQTRRDSDIKKLKIDPDIRKEYDFSGGIRGKHAKRYAEGANVVVIDADVGKYFPDHEAVNEALRSLTKIIKKRQKAEQANQRGPRSRASG